MQTGTLNLPADARTTADAFAKVQQAARTPVKIEKQEKIDTRELARLQSMLAERNISLRFSQDETTNQIVVHMVDDKTGEAIRQFPTAVSLSLAANFMKLQGVFLDVAR